MKFNIQPWQRQAAMFLISQNISLFGSSVVGFAVTWYITLQTSSGTWTMLSTLATTLPYVLVAIFGGVWADRHSRKMLIIAADGFIALATLGLAISFIMGLDSLHLLLVVLAVRSIGAGIQGPAVSAIYPQLVPEEHLTRVQGINQSMMSILMLLSPAAGGLLLGSVGIVAAFFVDVVTAGIAMLVMSRLEVAAVPRGGQDISVWADLKAGLKYTFNNRQLRRIIICMLFAFFMITPAAVLSPLMVERTFGSEVWRLTANELVWTVGSLLGGAYVAFKGEFKNKVRTISLCLIAFGLLFGLLGISWDFVSYLTFMGIAGCFMPVVTSAQTVYIQQLAEPEKLGRVFSLVQMISHSAVPVAILLFGPLADVVTVEWLLIVSGILLAVVGVVYGYSDVQAAPEKAGESMEKVKL